MELRLMSGCLCLVGPQIDEIVQQSLPCLPTILSNFNADCSLHFVILLDRDEVFVLSETQLSNITIVDTSRLYSSGVGHNPKVGAHFIVIIWIIGQQIRKTLGFPPKQFYINLSALDVCDGDKGIDSLLPGQFPSDPSPDFLDDLTITLNIFGCYQKAKDTSIKLAEALPLSPRGFLRLGDAALGMGQYKLAMLSYACAWERTTEFKTRDYAIKRKTKCAKHTEWGPLFLDAEMSQLPNEIMSLLLTPWSAELRMCISELRTTLIWHTGTLFMALPTVNSMSHHPVPQYFRWLIPYHIAISTSPRGKEDIKALASPHLQIRHILTLTEEAPLDHSWFTGTSVTNSHLPIPNSPSKEQVEIFLRMSEDESKRPLLIHCGGGRGRAGTLAACYLVAYGFSKPNYQQTQPTMSADEAIAALETIWPGWVEDPQQKHFVFNWHNTIQKRKTILSSVAPEPLSCPLEIRGDLTGECNLFVLVGMAGSGKSWLSKALLVRNPAGWTHIPQDTSESRLPYETELSRGRGRVIIDGCNASVADRESWLKLASRRAMVPVCVYFDYDTKLCCHRAQSRVGHRTLLPGGKVRHAIAQWQKTFEQPSLNEAYKAIAIIRSFAAAEELIARLSPSVGLLKFPRTPHLFDLGAVSSDDVLSNTPLLLPDSSSTHVVITEKIDGANLGFSLSSDRSKILVQNRSHYVNPATHEQFKKLGLWVDSHRKDLQTVLDRDEHFAQRYILFGEWMYATHSIPYTKLPSLFIAFDLYDRSTDTWADRESLSSLLSLTSIPLVPVLYDGRLPTNQALEDMVQQQSKFWDGRVEGIYLKAERHGKVISRGKVVRGDFIIGNEHWTKGDFCVNGLETTHKSLT